MAMTAGLLTACDCDTVYCHYEHILADGWDRNDTLHFQVPPVTIGGTYKTEVGIRINSDYPFRNLSLLVEQTNTTGKNVISDTLKCVLSDNQGNHQGGGISEYQYVFPLKTVRLEEGESTQFCILHYMKNETLKGITDIGIRTKKQ